MACRRVLLWQPGIGNVTADRIWKAIGGHAVDAEALVGALDEKSVTLGRGSSSRKCGSWGTGCEVGGMASTSSSSSIET